MMNCVIVDDEPMAAEGLSSYVREIGFLNLVDTCENPVELSALLNRQTIDLVFLDIQMPKMSGIDFLRTVQKPPLVVIISAFPSYALEGFQLNVLDYLVKPVLFDRFFKAAVKAHDYHTLLENAADNRNNALFHRDYLFIKCGNRYERIFFQDILFIEGLENYVNIYTRKGKYMTLQHLKSWNEYLDSRLFVRVHKSYIVAKKQIDGIEGNTIYIGDHNIPIGRTFREQALNEILH